MFAVLLIGLKRVVPSVKSEPLRKNFLLFIVKVLPKVKTILIWWYSPILFQG